MRFFTSLLFLLCFRAASGQGLYFPPTSGATWDTTSPASLGWCVDHTDSLYDYLEASGTKAFIVLKDGRIVLEKYFGTFVQDSFWYWASAGKTLTGFMVGKAQEEGYLSINDTTAHYLGDGWTSCSTAAESAIAIRHQLTMTTGFNDDAGNVDCTLPACLQCLAEPGTRWAYHNAPYTLLQAVIDSAIGSATYNQYFNQKLRNPIGMNGLWLVQDTFNHIYYSTARSAARFGLLMLADGRWDGATILADTAYLHAAHNTSQPLNQSYGYLWWLNGKASYRLPGSQLQFTGAAMPNAPMDLYAALGKNGQIVNVVPSQNLVLVRFGNAPWIGQAGPAYNDTVWQKLNAVICSQSSGVSGAVQDAKPAAFPNPAHGMLQLPPVPGGWAEVALCEISGRVVRAARQVSMLDVTGLPAGVYMLKLRSAREQRQQLIRVE